jgi:hypothetical protein
VGYVRWRADIPSSLGANFLGSLSSLQNVVRTNSR